MAVPATADSLFAMGVTVTEEGGLLLPSEEGTFLW